MTNQLPDTSPILDRERLQEIADLALLAREDDAVLQDIAARAARHFDLPISLVSIVLDDAQHFAAAHGLQGWLAETRGTPIEWSFCRIAVERREPYIVVDAGSDPLVRENPLVRLDGIRCYAGIPLISARGHALGSFCVLGPVQRQFSQDDLNVLRGFADEVMQHIESRRPHR